MLSGDSNLNLLSYDSSANLLNHVLSLGFRVKRILLDALGPAETHLNNLRKRIPALKDKNIEMISESKADFKYPVVSAASIVAKVSRDYLLKTWQFKERKDDDND